MAVVPTMNVRNKHAVIIVTTCNDIILNKGRMALNSYLALTDLTSRPIKGVKSLVEIRILKPTLS